MPVVLLVDDDLGDVVLLQQALQRAAPDVEVRIARLHDEALAMAVGVDLVLLDLNMAGTHGLDILADLRAQEATKRTPVVISTTSAASSDIHRAYEVGANAFVTKPADLDGTVHMMDAICRFWLGVACAS